MVGYITKQGLRQDMRTSGIKTGMTQHDASDTAKDSVVIDPTSGTEIHVPNTPPTEISIRAGEIESKPHKRDTKKKHNLKPVMGPIDWDSMRERAVEHARGVGTLRVYQRMCEMYEHDSLMALPQQEFARMAGIKPPMISKIKDANPNWFQTTPQGIRLTPEGYKQTKSIVKGDSP